MSPLPTIAKLSITLGVVQAVRGLAIIAFAIGFYRWRRRVYVRGVKEAYKEGSRRGDVDGRVRNGGEEGVDAGWRSSGNGRRDRDGNSWVEGDGDEEGAPPAYMESV
jgi:hypothetical protein